MKLDAVKIKFVYGKEFFDELKSLITHSQKRIFIMSAFIGKKTYEEILSCKPKHINCLTMVRSDNNNNGEKYYPENSIVINHEDFHGKLYLIDNSILIGSQNLRDVGKKGEFSVLFELSELDASLIFYQALLTTIESELIYDDPVDCEFLDFYTECCPFCGSTNIVSEDVLSCSNGDGFVLDDDCRSYGGEGVCQYCTFERRQPLEGYFCGGCNLGISSDGYLVFHEFNNGSNKELLSAEKYMALFNFFKNKNANPIEIFKMFKFNGGVYNISLKREPHKFVNLSLFNSLFDKYQEAVKKDENDLKKEVIRMYKIEKSNFSDFSDSYKSLLDFIEKS